MRKILTTVVLGSFIIAGFLITQDQPVDVASELEPTVFSISPNSFLY